MAAAAAGRGRSSGHRPYRADRRAGKRASDRVHDLAHGGLRLASARDHRTRDSTTREQPGSHDRGDQPSARPARGPVLDDVRLLLVACERVLQLRDEREGGRRAPGRILRKRPLEYRVYRAREVGRGGCRRHGIVDVCGGLRGRRAPAERPVSGQELVRDDAQRVDVARRRRSLSTGLLRREVAGGPEHCARFREPAGGVQDTRDAEVGDVHVLPGVEQEIGGLDVAMDDPFGVRCVECLRRLLEPAQRLPATHAAAGDAVRNRPAVDQLHHDERPLLVADVVDRDHVRMS